MKKVIIKKNRYVDSVSLMAVSDRVTAMEGVENAEAAMATPANREVLDSLGYEVPKEATPNDLVIAVTADDGAVCEKALQLGEDILDHKTGAGEKSYRTLEEIDLTEDGYDLVQISLPGEYAAAEAEKALRMGLDVFIFSDNVSLEEEQHLKELGRELGRLVMGPDCGVGLLGGVALAAGSILRDGPVGIVGASGSGAQEVGCIVEKCGLGVSGIIGTGGHDLYPQIGGITMLEGLRRLEADEKTKVIVLVSKLADLGVMDRVLTAADGCSKPVTAVFLGGDEKFFAGHRVLPAYSLEEAALNAVELVTGERPIFGYTDAEIETLADRCVERLRLEQKYFRGLYCGGTFTEEALLCFSRHSAGSKLYSNLKNSYSEKLPSSHVSRGHSILDLGAEDFTAEAPHPVFDPALRLRRFRQELRDLEVGVILLDFITGPGVHRDPITPFAEECAREMAARGGALVVIASICGSAEDPQNVAEKEKLLREAGVVVTRSNYQSAKLACALMNRLDGRQTI